MNPVLTMMAKFVRSLLSYEEQLIRIGRQNFERKDFEAANIVIDQLGSNAKVGNMEDFDWTAEELKIGAMWRGIITLDFYGNDAYTRAIEFSLKAKSQAAADLKKSLGFNAYNAKGPVDLKALTGQQYGERVQIEMTVELSSDVTIDTLRIDVPQFQIRNEEGVQNG